MRTVFEGEGRSILRLNRRGDDRVCISDRDDCGDRLRDDCSCAIGVPAGLARPTSRFTGNVQSRFSKPIAAKSRVVGIEDDSTTTGHILEAHL
ncbi:hypothetical protein D9M73_113890 [compost metagenome]